MKTKKNLVKTMLMSILTAGTFGMGMTACSDDLNEFGTAATETAVAGSDLMNLEQHSYTVPVEIQNEGAWKVDFRFSDDNRHFCYALPAEGVGPQTIKLCVLDNWTDERNAAEMVITDMVEDGVLDGQDARAIINTWLNAGAEEGEPKADLKKKRTKSYKAL